MNETIIQICLAVLILLAFYWFICGVLLEDVQSNPSRVRDEPNLGFISTLVEETRVARDARRAARNKRITNENILCPLCRDVLGDGICCNGCATAFHNECLSEIAGGKCPTMGCKGYL